MRFSSDREHNAVVGESIREELMNTTSRLRIMLSMFALLAAASSPMHAQTFPTRPVRIIVGYPPGGTVDFMARIVAGKLSEPLGQQVLVDNRPGGGTVIGTEIVAKAPPDGHTLLMANIAFGANPALHAKLPYDTLKDFSPVSLVALLPSFLVVHPSLPVHSVKELVALAKAKPGQLSYASAGVGSLLHLTMERLKNVAGIDIAHIPYKGAAPALSDVLGGQLAIMFIPGPPALAHMKSGRLRPLAVTSLERMSLMPDVPTIAESGYPGFELYDWEGLIAPAHTPPAVIARLNSEVNRILNIPEVKQYVLSQGANAVGSTPDELAERIRKEVALWPTIVKPGD
jgi:tripartite-type tricarboxylate transporter receptor subunit TctC